MVRMSEPPGGGCYRCDDEDVETATHTIHFFDDRESRTVDLCAPCVRMVRESENGVRSIV